MNARRVMRYLRISPTASWDCGCCARPIMSGISAYNPASTSALTARRTRMLQCAHSVMRGKMVAQNFSSAMLNTRSHGTSTSSKMIMQSFSSPYWLTGWSNAVPVP